MINIQARIKELMDFRGWSEYKLAKEANLPQSTISHLFKRNNAPNFNTTEAICGAFGITICQFFAGKDELIPITDEQREVLLLWGTLNDEQRRIVKSTMEQFNIE